METREILKIAFGWIIISLLGLYFSNKVFEIGTLLTVVIIVIAAFIYWQAVNPRHQVQYTRETKQRPQRARSRESQQRLDKFIEELKKRGFEVSPKSDRLYYHPHIPDTRFAILTRVIRLERRVSDKRGRRQWQREKSFSIAREIHLALEGVEFLLKKKG
jgi:uncharacterized protein YxeA